MTSRHLPLTYTCNQISLVPPPERKGLGTMDRILTQCNVIIDHVMLRVISGNRESPVNVARLSLLLSRCGEAAEAEGGSGSVGRRFAGVMRRSAEERRVSKSSSGPNRLEELANVLSTHRRTVSQLCSCSGYCFAHFSSTPNLFT